MGRRITATVIEHDISTLLGHFPILTLPTSLVHCLTPAITQYCGTCFMSMTWWALGKVWKSNEQNCQQLEEPKLGRAASVHSHGLPCVSRLVDDTPTKHGSMFMPMVLLPGETVSQRHAILVFPSASKAWLRNRYFPYCSPSL